MIGDSILDILYVGVLIYIGFKAYVIMAGERVEYGMQQAARMQGAEIERTAEIRQDEVIEEKEKKITQKEKASVEEMKRIILSIEDSALKEQGILRHLQSNAVDGEHRGEILNQNNILSAKELLQIIDLCNVENQQLTRVYDILMEDENWSKRVTATTGNMAKKIAKYTRKVDHFERNASAERQITKEELVNEHIRDHWVTLDKRRMEEVVGDEGKMTHDLRVTRSLCHHVRDDLNKDIIKYCTDMRTRAENLKNRRRWMDLMKNIIHKRDLLIEIMSSLNMIAEIEVRVEKELDAGIEAAKRDENLKT